MTHLWIVLLWRQHLYFSCSSLVSCDEWQKYVAAALLYTYVSPIESCTLLSVT